MKKRINDLAKQEVSVISAVIFEFYIYGREIEDQKQLSERVNIILADNEIQKDTDLWKKAWRMYYDWIHFINWRRKKTTLKDKDKEINKKIAEMVDQYKDDAIKKSINDVTSDDVADDLPF